MGGKMAPVTRTSKEDEKEHLHQTSTGSADVWKAPEDTFLKGNGVTHPERMSKQAKMLYCRTDPGYLAHYLDMQVKLDAGAHLQQLQVLRTSPR
ncbi:hypothetical protein MASR1M50_01110 [Burkholderiales bacterium]